jgi:putative transposase
VILGLLDEAQANGARLAPACKVLEMNSRTIQRWKRGGIGDDRRAGPLTKPGNALSSAERAKIIEIANTPEFRDKGPKQIVPILADRGRYVASEATFYRILREAQQLHHRASSNAPSKRHRPEPHTATGPNQVWTWDITYLRSTLKGSFFYLYMMLDIWSRKMVGFAVHEVECSDFASWLLEASCKSEGILPGSLVLHSDNGSPMKGATMLAKLQQLGVAPSFSRPSVSNDNPFSESAFRTAKYRPDYPSKPFGSLEEARAWAASFVHWYNTEHLHSSINFVTPDDRHAGRHVEILKIREQVYAEAKQRHPERWARETRDWSPV